MRRLWTLVSYFIRDLFRSLTGLLVIVAAMVFYLVAIVSVTGGIDRDYYALVIGVFFGVFSLILALVVADRAYRSESYLLLYRLSPSWNLWWRCSLGRDWPCRWRLFRSWTFCRSGLACWSWVGRLVCT